MHHVIVSRFSVPRLDAATAGRHRDRAWLDRRLELFRRWYVPSVSPLGVPAVLLCSSDSAAYVADRTADLAWARVVEQDDWHGGWAGAPGQVLTRLDTDDALHRGWFEAVDAAPRGYQVYSTRRFYRLDPARRALYARARRLPSPLAAFAPGLNPYLCDHVELARRFRAWALPRRYLLQVVHGGNVSSRRPRWWHAPYRVPLARLAPFGLRPGAVRLTSAAGTHGSGAG